MTVCGVDAEDLTEMIAEIRQLDPKPGALFDHAASAAHSRCADAPGGGGRMAAGAEPRDHAASSSQPQLLYPGRASGRARGAAFHRRTAANRELAREVAATARADDPEVATEIVRQQDLFFAKESPISAR